MFFTDATLGAATVGTAYSDILVAQTLSNGLSTGHPVTYSALSALPTGLSLNPATGTVTGTPASSVLPGVYPFSFTATSPGYPSQTGSTTLSVLGAPTIVRVLAFIDSSLMDAQAGLAYGDNVAAEAFANFSVVGQAIAFTTSTTLPAGLTLNSSNGWITGIVGANVASRTYPLVITASAPGYPSVSTIVNLLVAAAAAPVFTMNTTILFAFNSSVINKTAISTIASIAKYIKANNLTDVNLVGTASYLGGTRYNTALALARASAVLRLLKLDLGPLQNIMITSVTTNLASSSKSYSVIAQY
jgi:outer membrane protein OmpA-like peptidoglycan-associated protein